MRKTAAFLVLALTTLLWLSSPAIAQKRWGAVAVGPNGGYGWATNVWTQREAEAAAIENCYGECITGYTFYDSCGAIAMGGDLAFSGGGATQAEAEAQALEFCRTDVGEGCEIKVWACTEK